MNNMRVIQKYDGTYTFGARLIDVIEWCYEKFHQDSFKIMYRVTLPNGSVEFFGRASVISQFGTWKLTSEDGDIYSLYQDIVYQFEYNEDRDYTYKIEGAEKAVYDILEMPISMHCHYDLWNFKIIANAGCYAGYRIGIHRYPGKTGNVNPEVQNSFVKTDRRWDYGLKGGLGIGFVFDPVEFHITATYKHSFGTLYEPDYSSEYYYRYAYPMNITISAGMHIHLTKRTGKTKAELRKEARESVYGVKK